MRINYDFADLEAFLAVKETGSFHQAAKRLALSQSAVTRRVQKLEAAMGAALFERTTRAVKPTLAAKRLQARAEAMLEDARETARAMRDESDRYAHQRRLLVTVAALPTVVPVLLPRAIQAFRAAGHRSRIRILDLATNEVAEAVAQGEADFGICAIPSLEPGTRFERLFDDALGVVAARTHPLAERERASWDDLAAYELILPARQTGNRLLIDEAAATAKRTLTWSFEATRSATALGLAAAGVGAAILPRSAMAGDAGAAVVWLPLVDPDLVRPVGLLTRSGATSTPETSALQEALRRVRPS